MQKYKIEYSAEAKNDIRNIFAYIEQISSEENAKMVLRRLAKKIRSFSVFPERNEIFAKASNGLPIRITVSGKYRIAYIVNREKKEVIISRILSVSQDPNRL